MKTIFILCATAAGLFGLSGASRAQPTVPVNLYVADLKWIGDSMQVGTPRKLTADRGINSQPAFTPDGNSILFVRRDSTSAQSDVYRIDLTTGAESRVTSTPENENSPTVTPDGNIMVIRWTPPTLFKEWGPWIYDQKGQPLKGVLPGPDTVGYYVRLDSTRFAVMRPKTRFAVAIFDARTGTTTDYDWPVATLPPQIVPGQKAVSYTRVDSVGGNRIRRLDLVTYDTTEIAPALPGKRVHAWTPRGTIVMGKDNVIYTLKPPARKWTAVATFTDPQLQDINAYVVSPRGDRIILISPVSPPPK